MVGPGMREVIYGKEDGSQLFASKAEADAWIAAHNSKTVCE